MEELSNKVLEDINSFTIANARDHFTPVSWPVCVRMREDACCRALPREPMPPRITLSRHAVLSGNSEGRR